MSDGQALADALEEDGPLTIRVQGALSMPNTMNDVESDKTVIGAPGAVLDNGLNVSDAHNVIIRGVASTMGAGVLVEGNHFENVTRPTAVGYAGSGPGDLVRRDNVFVNSGAPESAGTVNPIPYAYSLDLAATVRSVPPRRTLYRLACMRYELLDSAAAAPLGDLLTEVYAEVYAEPPYREGPEQVARFRERYPEDVGRTGFVLVRAVDGGELAGVAYGWTMEPGRWWPGAVPEPPERLRAAAKAALLEWIVRAPWRGRGVGGELLRRWLNLRSEPWATLVSHPAAPARRVYTALGWQQAGTLKPDLFPELDVLTLPLRQDGG
ncbi:GNAT family N-acetyltransferase [Catenuloplanes atrovinosus]|uniref:RimJ/RimL family protein N-acetyltransferase n=1 Tax=Catenuloplanes atrovinosus TaxID=137266 RepID=A0AAE4CDM1_9ACTN|nr:GNAT family N-acetyltransferase [Catenuloplanes atrovinosus]MDR7280363.1 RimJ/RimL family protein N-acetyltransferase [Catenuloplanes atrovinosus]